MSTVYLDPRMTVLPSRFIKGDIVHMSIIEGGIWKRGEFGVVKTRMHPSNSFYEYQLGMDDGKLYKNGVWVRESRLGRVRKDGGNIGGLTGSAYDAHAIRDIQESQSLLAKRQTALEEQNNRDTQELPPLATRKSTRSANHEEYIQSNIGRRERGASSPSQRDIPDQRTATLMPRKFDETASNTRPIVQASYNDYHEIIEESSTPGVREATTAPSLAYFSDPGYASPTRHDKLPSSTIGSSNDRGDHDDGMTIYSVDSSHIPVSTKEAYIRELSEDLMSRMLAEAKTLDDSSVERVYDRLSGALQAFAKMIGHLGKSQEARDVMVFMSRHREKVMIRLRNQMEEKKLQFGSEHESDDPNLKQKAQFINSWLQDDSVRDENPTDIFEGVSDDPEDAIGDTIALPHYQDAIVNSPAYGWLLCKLYCELHLMLTEPNIMHDISGQILRKLSYEAQFRHISRGRSPHLCIMEFRVDWDPFAFILEQEYDKPAEQAIARAITVTGSASEAQALTTQQYLKQTWGLVGEESLALFQNFVRPSSKAILLPQFCLLTNGTALEVMLQGGSLVLKATGTLEAIAEIGQLISWLGAALRSSPQENGIVYCYPIISEISIRRQFSDRTSANCKIDFRFEAVEEDEGMSESNGRCWRDLFRNPVVVKGYPIRNRSAHDVGLEIPLDIMAALVGSHRITRFADRAFLKSFSAMLLLNNKIGDILVWHLLFNEDGDHMSYADHRVRLNPGPSTETLNMSTLSTSRHIVGWCLQVKHIAGGPDANYNIEWSGLPKPHQRCAFDKVSISGGKVISASVSAILGKKDKAVYIKSRSDYISQLKWLEKKYVVLYDLEDRRGWLVDGVSTLLHLVRASLEGDLHDSFKEHFQYRPEQLKEADTDRNGKAAAISVLTSIDNQNLTLYRKPEENYKENTTNQKGETEEVSKKKKTYLCFKDRVEIVYHLLEQIITHQSHVDSEDGVGFRIKYTPRRQLEGFDFMDIASDEDPFWPRVTTLRATGAGWVDFARSIHAITLFGRGFGELMKPSEADQPCVHWKEVPTGLDYLAVSASAMDDILKKRGNRKANPWLLVDDIRWITPDKLFQTCDCSKTDSTKRGCDRVQVLLSTNSPKLYTGTYKSPETLDSSGAIILGHSWKYPLRWTNRGEPEEGEPSTEDDRPSSLYDSGLGSSLAPSSRPEGSTDLDATSNVSSDRPVKQLPERRKRTTLDAFHMPRLWRK